MICSMLEILILLTSWFSLLYGSYIICFLTFFVCRLDHNTSYKQKIQLHHLWGTKVATAKLILTESFKQKPNGNVGNSYLGPQQLRNIAVMNHSRARNDEVRNRKKFVTSSLNLILIIVQPKISYYCYISVVWALISPIVIAINLKLLVPKILQYFSISQKFIVSLFPESCSNANSCAWLVHLSTLKN